ncbi:hypothetical protein ACPV5S_15575 [Vibrio astriarenae]
MTETEFYGKINKRVRCVGHYAWSVMTTMQNGVPDCFYRGLNGAKKPPLWVEYKMVKVARPKTKPTQKLKLGLSALQRQWIEQAHANGEQVWLAVAFKTSRGVIGSVVLDHPSLMTDMVFDHDKQVVTFGNVTMPLIQQLDVEIVEKIA